MAENGLTRRALIPALVPSTSSVAAAGTRRRRPATHHHTTLPAALALAAVTASSPLVHATTPLEGEAASALLLVSPIARMAESGEVTAHARHDLTASNAMSFVDDVSLFRAPAEGESPIEPSHDPHRETRREERARRRDADPDAARDRELEPYDDLRNPTNPHAAHAPLQREPSPGITLTLDLAGSSSPWSGRLTVDAEAMGL